MRELGIFFDESGDFGLYSHKSPNYIVGIVFHDQANNISEPLEYLERKLRNTVLNKHCVHVGPLIRREGRYRNMQILDRIRILRSTINFVAKADIYLETIVVDKKHLADSLDLEMKLIQQLSNFIKDNYEYFLHLIKLKSITITDRKN